MFVFVLNVFMDYKDEDLFFLQENNFVNKAAYQSYKELWKSFGLIFLDFNPDQEPERFLDSKENDLILDRIRRQSKHSHRLRNAYFIVEIHRVLESHTKILTDQIQSADLEFEYAPNRKPNEFDYIRQDLKKLLRKNQATLFNQVDECLEVLAKSKAMRNEFLHTQAKITVQWSDQLEAWKAAVKLLVFIDRKSFKY